MSGRHHGPSAAVETGFSVHAGFDRRRGVSSIAASTRCGSHNSGWRLHSGHRSGFMLPAAGGDPTRITEWPSIEGAGNGAVPGTARGDEAAEPEGAAAIVRLPHAHLRSGFRLP